MIRQKKTYTKVNKLAEVIVQGTIHLFNMGAVLSSDIRFILSVFPNPCCSYGCGESDRSKRALNVVPF